MSSQPPVLAIFGPTASGKSEVAAALAAKIDGTLIAADAMQTYRGVPILTNQPSEPTKLVGIWPLDHEASVGEYAPMAHEAIDSALDAASTPIVVGGTGLYLRAALADLDIPPRSAPGVRDRLEELYGRDAGRSAHLRLQQLDPDTARLVHVNDRRRVIRALELAEVGRSLRPQAEKLWTDATRHPTIIVGIDAEPAGLEERIMQRTAAMFAAGAADEARRALEGPISATAMKVIGLQEAADLSETNAVHAIGVKTRRYAAYQRKWMRRIPNISLISSSGSPDGIAHEILEMARARQ
jgi:tRNA dimethylallyltransferase